MPQRPRACAESGAARKARLRYAKGMIAPSPMPPVTRVPVPGLGPEDPVIAADGTVYAALRDEGRLLRVRPGAERAEVVASLGGRGLGCELMADGRVLVCNADLGLQAVDPGSGEVEGLLGEAQGMPFVLCNNASVARDGTIYLSESSRAHDLGAFRRDIVEDTRTGRLLRWRPGSEPETLLDGLAFANGVALSPDEDFVLVAETGQGRVHRVWLAGAQKAGRRAGEAEAFAEVPGYPDNLSVGETPGPDGGPLYWCAVPALPAPALARIHALPGPARRLIARVPERFGPQAPDCCRVAAFDGEGRLVHLLDGDPERYRYVTGVRERGGRVWLGSIMEDALGWFDLP